MPIQYPAPGFELKIPPYYEPQTLTTRLGDAGLCCQYYKDFAIVKYDSRVVLQEKFELVSVTLDQSRQLLSQCLNKIAQYLLTQSGKRLLLLRIAGFRIAIFQLDLYFNVTSSSFFQKWAIPGLFFVIFVFSIHLTVNNVQYNFWPVTGFELRTSGFGSDHSSS